MARFSAEGGMLPSPELPSRSAGSGTRCDRQARALRDPWGIASANPKDHSGPSESQAFDQYTSARTFPRNTRYENTEYARITGSVRPAPTSRKRSDSSAAAASQIVIRSMTTNG